MSQEEAGSNSRLETFCDGIFAIALTLLVLEFKTPAEDSIHANADLWLYLRHLLPSVSAFLLSFIIIAISWVSHHGTLKLIRGTHPKFIYANIFMMVSIVLFPFATALIAEFAFTPFAAPAVVAYCAVILLTNIGWILLCAAALRGRGLARDEACKKQLEKIAMQSRQGFALYAGCTVLAFWFPLLALGAVLLSWIGWLVVGINLKSNH